MDRLREMSVFCQVAESGNFTRAAQAMGLPRSTVSTVIQALEDRLGVQLLRRTTRQMVITDEGMRFLARARDILDTVADADQMFRTQADRLVGRLRIDLPSRIGRRYVIPALPEWFAEHPDLNVELSTTDRRVDLVSEGVDCLIRAGALESSEIICRKIGDMRMVTCAAPDYLARHGVPRCPADLDSHLVINYSQRLPAETCDLSFRTKGRVLTVAMKTRIAVDNVESYLGAARAGLGLVQVPAFDVQHHLDSGRLVPVLAEFSPPPLQLSLLYARRRNVPLRIDVFGTWVIALLRNRGVIDFSA